MFIHISSVVRSKMFLEQSKLFLKVVICINIIIMFKEIKYDQRRGMGVT